MFAVRPDAFWPWLYVKPPSDDPPGFRVAAIGSGRDAGVDEVGFVLRGYDSGLSGAALADIGFEGAYRPNGDDNPFNSLDRRGPGIGQVPSFDGGSAPPYSNSLLFRQMGVPSPGLGDYGGGLDAQSRTPLPRFRVKPPADEPPGFRVVADGSVRDAQINDVGLTLPGYGSGVSGTALADVGFGRAYRPASDGNPFGFLDRRGADVGAMPSFDGASLPQHAISFLFPKMTEAQLPWPGVQGYGSELDVQPAGPLPGFNVKPPTHDPPGFRVVPDGPTPSNFAVTPPIGGGSDYRSRPMDNGVHPTLYGTLDLPYLPRPPRAPVLEALDQIAKIYAGIGANPDSLFDGQGSNTGSVVLRDGFGGGLAPTVDEGFDPQYVLPTQAGGSRPPPTTTSRRRRPSRYQTRHGLNSRCRQGPKARSCHLIRLVLLLWPTLPPSASGRPPSTSIASICRNSTQTTLC